MSRLLEKTCLLLICLLPAIIMVVLGAIIITKNWDGHNNQIITGTCQSWVPSHGLKREAYPYRNCFGRNETAVKHFFPNTKCNLSVACVCDDVFCLPLPENVWNTFGFIGVLMVVFGILITIGAVVFCCM